MKFISWNVNGIRACCGKGFDQAFIDLDADFFCLQETKMQAGQFDLAFPGYQSYWNFAEKKGYSGTAIFTRHQPLSVTYGLPGMDDDNEGRVITLEMPTFYLVTVYTPNSQDGLRRLPYRMIWDDQFRHYLYATNLDEQYPFIESAKNKGYDVLLMDCELDSHFVNLLEQKVTDCRFARVDSDSIENLIPKEEKVKPELSEEKQKELEELFKSALPQGNEYMVEAQNLGENAEPVLITQSEFMRRYREMSALGGGLNFYGEMPASYNIIVNMESPLVQKIVESGDKESALLRQVTDLALLSNGMLKGKALADFIARSRELLK